MGRTNTKDPCRRMVTPRYDDLVLRPSARVSAVEVDRVVFDIDAVLEEGAVAMVGQVVIPL